jgi:raffinose/stachyose/melibiose transport system substrate-binding protein
MTPRNLLVHLTLLVALVVSLAACAAVAPQAAAPADEAVEGEVTLVVWDIMARPEESAILDGLVTQYEAANPGVKVERSAKTLDDLKVTAALALADENGPDIVQVNQGESDMGALVAAGLLLPLDDYAEQYGWYDNFPSGLVALNSWTEDGSQMGEGNLYGLPTQAEVVGVYYNRAKFDELGLEIPTTMAEFEAVMDALAAAGETPLVYGNLDGWPAIHLYSELQNAILGEREWYDNFMYLTGEVDFDTPENLAAAQLLRDWIDKGYFPDGFQGIGYDDSWQLFSSGVGGMMLTGNWLTGEFLAGPNADNIGFFLLPPMEEDGYKMSVGGTSLAFAIRNGTTKADLAAEYIDYLFSQETADGLAESGLLPLRPVDESVLTHALLADVADAWQHLIEIDGVGYYMDWVTPTMYDTITSELQALEAGAISPEEFVQNVNEDYTAFLAQKQ